VADIPGLLSVLDLPQAVGLITPCWLQFPPSATEEHIRSAYVVPLGLQTRKDPDESMLRLTRSGESDWNHAAEWLQAQLKSSGDQPR
jgi:hypothetical protein